MKLPKSRFDLGTLAILVVLLAMAAYTVAGSDWAPGLDLLQITSLAGLMLGVVIARSKFKRLPAHLLALGYGAAWIALLSIDHLPRAAGASGLGEQMIALGRHISEWVWLLLQTGVGKDNFMFLLSLMIVFWLMGYFAAWYTFRVVKVLRVVLPAGLVILINLYYYGGRVQLTAFLYLYFACVLLYLARIHYTLREREWQRARVGYDADVRSSIVRGGSIVTVLAIAVAWAVPEITPMPQFDDLWRQISKPMRSLEDGFNRVFAALQGDGPALTNPYGRTLGFGGARNLGDTVVMDVYVHPSPDNASALARYWRAMTADVYTSNGWIDSSSDTYIFNPKADELATPYELRSNVDQTFTFYFPRTTQLFAAGQPVYFSRDAEADAQLLSATGGGVQAKQVYVDPSIVISYDLLRPGDSYDTISSLSIADINSLRNAGDDYPDWITSHYLQLPDNFPQRVKDLAHEIVTQANATNPFDQATALERWLRTNITYNDKIEGPRPGQDGVEYVLFDSRAGYCDYYASSMATMARSLGIPARMARGYAQGEYVPSGEVFRVRERDAHTWVEIFFPRYGWVEFEPTAAQPLVNRPVPADVNDTSLNPSLPPTPSSPIDRLSRLGEEEGITQPASDVLPILVTQTLPRGLFVLASLLVVGAVLATGAIYVYENRGLRHLAGTRWAYARLVRLARWLRVDLTPFQTPYEQADLINEAAPSGREEVAVITDDYVRETFGRDDSGARRARSIWRQVHVQLWLAGFKRRFLGFLARRRTIDLSKLRLPGRRG